MTTSTRPLTLPNGTSSKSNNGSMHKHVPAATDVHCVKAPPSTPAPANANDLESDLDDALVRIQQLLETAQQLDAVDADVVRKAAAVSAAAAELTHCLQRTHKGSNNSNSNSNSNSIAPRKQFDALEATPHESDTWTTTPSTTAATASSTATLQPSIWSGFYNKTLRERFDVLSLLYPRLGRPKALSTADAAASAQHPSSDSHATLDAIDPPVAKLGELPLRTANLMIENCIGVLGIPLGLGLNFVIDGKSLSIPMAIEEPSVVAAASSAAKLVASFGGGFRTATTGNIMTSQIQLVATPDVAFAIEAIAANRTRLLAIANTTLCANMKKRGGGAVDIYCRVVSASPSSSSSSSSSIDSNWYVPCSDELSIVASSATTTFVVVHIDVDVCEAMGANIVNTVAEGLSDEVCRLTKSQCGLRILTNLCMQRRARATFELPVAKLGWKGVEGLDVAQRIVDAYNFAAIDPYRAVTNNKGIMNGIDAVAVATGQDFRAIEAAAHCYASRTGQYASLSHYAIVKSEENGTVVLRGQLELPLAVGSKGGALQTHPGYTATHAILHHPTARTLSSILVSVGLAQNFAAIRAIATTGIQKGHMALHARNIAVAAGAPSELVTELCAYMLGRARINVETAKQYLHAHAVYSEIASNSPPLSPVAASSSTKPAALPSMFYVEIPVPHLEGSISLNIAFESLAKSPQYIAIMAPSPTTQTTGATSSSSSVQHQLLGDKGFNQLEKMFLFLASMRSIVVVTDDASEDQAAAARSNLALQNKLQLLSILLNILANRLLETRALSVRTCFNELLACRDLREWDTKRSRALLDEVSASADDALCTGLPLFLALYQVFHYHIEQEVAHTLLREHLVTEQRRLLHAIVASYEFGDATPSAAAAERMTQASRDKDDKAPLTPAFVSYMRVQTKRWQATMLLLIDSLTLASDALTRERLAFLHRIGEHMEWEGTVAHDIARFKRAASEHAPNAFLYWLHERGVDADQADGYVDAFRRAADAFAQHQWRAITSDRASDAARVFSLPAVERVIRLIRDIYGERSGRRSRKESF